MSEARCRVFLALLPNIRHNALKALGEHLSQRVKRLQGIPPPDFSADAPKRGTTGAAARARAAAAARQREGTGGQPLMRWQRDAAMAMMDEEKKEQAEAEEAARRVKILDDGWKGGNLLDGLGDDLVGVLAGCSVSTFRRFDTAPHVYQDAVGSRFFGGFVGPLSFILNRTCVDDLACFVDVDRQRCLPLAARSRAKQGRAESVRAIENTSRRKKIGPFYRRLASLRSLSINNLRITPLQTPNPTLFIAIVLPSERFERHVWVSSLPASVVRDTYTCLPSGSVSRAA